MFKKKSASWVVIFAVLLVLFLGARAKREKETAAMLPPESMTYAVSGPYAVGNRTQLIEGETPLEINVWYPAENSSQDEAITYRYGVKMFKSMGAISMARFSGQAVRDSAYDLKGGPYPLVVLSPGFSFSTSTYAWLAEHLASYGFVVISPEHNESMDPENELWQSAIIRPQDVLTVFAYVDAQVGAGGVFEGLIDKDTAAVIGHSYGGYTALAAAGARIDTAEFEAHCQTAQANDDPTAWLCEMLLPHIADMAALAGLETVPEGLWPAWADSRVEAIVPLAGDAFFFGQNGLAEISVPVLAMGGTADTDSPFLWGTDPSYEYASSQRKIKIAFTDAEHMIFTASCEETPWYLKFFSKEFCVDQSWERGYAHNLTRHFTTAFLLAELGQDAAASTALQPDSVEFAQIVYDASGY